VKPSFLRRLPGYSAITALVLLFPTMLLAAFGMLHLVQVMAEYDNGRPCELEQDPGDCQFQKRALWTLMQYGPYAMPVFVGAILVLILKELPAKKKEIQNAG